MATNWQRHQAKLKQYIAKWISEPATVEDILQGVYLKALQQQGQLQDSQKLSAWLYRIAHNLVMDHFRQNKPEQPLPEDLTADEPVSAEQAHQQLAQCLAPMIDDLPERYGTPLRLAELQGFTQQQVADQLGLSLSGAKSRIQRGRQQLKQKLLACCEVEIAAGGVSDFQPKSSSCKNC